LLLYIRQHIEAWPTLDAITRRWFDAEVERGDIRVFTRRPPASETPAPPWSDTLGTAH